MSVKVRVAACTRIFRNARTDGTRRRGAGTFGGTGDFPGITLDLFNWVTELPQNVDDPRGWEGKVVAVRLASRTHGGFDTVGLVHRMSSCVWRLRSDRPILSVFRPLGSGRTLHREKRVLQDEMQSAKWAT